MPTELKQQIKQLQLWEHLTQQQKARILALLAQIILRQLRQNGQEREP